MAFPSQTQRKTFALISINIASISIGKFLFSFPLQQTRPNIYLSHEVFQKSNSWAIKPILIDIFNQLIKPKTKWFVLCDSNSVVNLRKLLESLDAEDETTVCVNIKFVKSNYFHLSLISLRF